MKIKNIKIIIALILSFVFAAILDRKVFIAHSPKINTAVISMKPKEKSVTIYPIGYKESNKNINNITNLLQPITKGVKAANTDNVSLTEYNMKDVEWIEVTYRQTDNTEIKIRTPKNMPK